MSRGEEILSEFLENIDRYIKSLHLGVVEENQNISKLLNFQFSDFEKLTATECGSAAYQLYAYAEYIGRIFNLVYNKWNLGSVRRQVHQVAS